MEHNPEEVSIHRRRAGHQRDGPQPDKADSSESRRGGNKRPFDIIPEEKEKDDFQDQFRGNAPSTFSAQGSQPDTGPGGTKIHLRISGQYDILSMTSTTPYIWVLFGNAAQKSPAQMIKESQDATGTYTYSITVDAPPFVVINWQLSLTVPLTIVIESADGHELARVDSAGSFTYTDAAGADLPQGAAEETFTSRSHRGRSIIRSHYDEPYPKRLGPIPPPLDLEKIRKQRVKSSTPQAPRPEVGDILVANYAFTARSSDELTLTKGDEIVLIENDDEFGDGWFSGEIPLTGKSGIFPATYASVKAHRVLPTILTDPRARSPDTTSDEPASIPTVPRLPSRSPTEIPSSPISSGYGADHEDDDNSDDGVVVIEEHIPSASLLEESDSVAGSSVRHTVSNTSYSAMFSEESREQPTDPSSWLDSSSADRAGMRGHQVDTTFSGTIEELVGAREVEECSRSISSVADSIGSANSDEGSLGQAGVNYVVAKFTQSDPELLALYTEATQRLTKDRFVDNNRRLLKRLYLDFAHEEQTPSQREAVAFFRSRRRRAEISLDIFKTVIPDNDENNLDDRREFSMLNAYFETLDAADLDKHLDNEQDALESDGSEFESVEEQPSLDMTSLQAIGEYFVTSRAFSRYKQRLHQFLHPDHEDKGELAAVQGKNSNEEEHVLDAPREIEPGLTDTGTDDSLECQNQGTRDQAEEHLDQHREGKIQNFSNSDDLRASLDSSTQIKGRPILMERNSLATWIAKWVTDTLCPPSKGSQRIWYFCGCGQHTYIDVKELEPGGMESEWRSISESSATARRAHSAPSSATPGGQLPSIPSLVHLGPTSSRNTASPNLPSQGTPHAPPPQLNPAAAISPALSGATRRDPMFLLICINGKAYKTLAELRCLDIDDSYNDELLIRGILNQYEQARKGCQWTIDLLLPRWMLPSGLFKQFKGLWKAVPFSLWRPSFIQDSLLVQSILEWWSRWASDVSPWAPLHIIDTADFVEFELVPHPEGKEAFPSHFTSGRWPAPDNKQYRYRPVPMKCIKTMNLWHMRRPGPHTEVYWYNTVPKKVDGALYRPSGTVEDIVGYGVRINERLNDVLVLWWSFMFVLVTGVFIYVYSNYTSDNSSAFGMGAYLVAAFTVYIQLQYAWWKRT